MGVVIENPLLTDANLKFLGVASKLQIFTVDTVADVAAGTVYRVVYVLATGADCPNILYAYVIN